MTGSLYFSNAQPAAVTPVELAQFCATRLGRTPPLGGWEKISHGEFFLLVVGLLGD